MNKYFRILDLPYDAPLSEVRKAYRDLVLVWHPDRFTGNERLQKAATEKLTQINEAYRFLRMHSAAEVEVDDKPSVAEDTIDWGAFAAPKKSDGRSTFTAERVAPRSGLQPGLHPKWLILVLLGILGAGVVLLATMFSPGKPNSAESTLPSPTEEAMNIQTVVDSLQLQTPPPAADTTSTAESDMSL